MNITASPTVNFTTFVVIPCLQVILFTFAASAATITVNFDDLNASAGDIVLDNLNPYHDFNWTNFSAYTNVPGFPGFNNGIVSGPNAAYSSGIGSISAPAFDFTGAALGSGYYDGLELNIEGLREGTVEYSQMIDVSTTGATAHSFDFKDIDTLLFTASTNKNTTDPYSCGEVGCSYFTVDNIDLKMEPASSNMPEPATWTMIGAGVMALISLRINRRSAHNPVSSALSDNLYD